jgi:hypothetical protein
MQLRMKNWAMGEFILLESLPTRVTDAKIIEATTRGGKSHVQSVVQY